MDAQGAEYLAAPLPPGLGRTVSPDTATVLAQRVVRALYPMDPTLQPYTPERLTGKVPGWFTAFRVTGGGEIIAVAIFETRPKHPAVLFMTVPSTDASLFPDIRPLLTSLLPSR